MHPADLAKAFCLFTRNNLRDMGIPDGVIDEYFTIQAAKTPNADGTPRNEMVINPPYTNYKVEGNIITLFVRNNLPVYKITVAEDGSYTVENIIKTLIEEGMKDKKPNLDIYSNSPVSQAAFNIKTALQEVIDEKDDNIVGNSKNIRTSFSIDKDGNMKLQNEDAQKVFDNIYEYLKERIIEFQDYHTGCETILKDIGGEAVLKQLVQAAWMSAYTSFDCSDKNNTTDFVNKVLSQLQDMLDKIMRNPEALNKFTMKPSYGDESLTFGLKYIPNAVTNIKGNATVYYDGTVHLSNEGSDNIYQETMEALLQNLIAKYSDIDSDFIEKIFRTAQMNAIKAAQSNNGDSPLGNIKLNSSDVRLKDLVQLTLYQFDKELMAQGAKRGFPAPIASPQEVTEPNDYNGIPQDQADKIKTSVPHVIKAIKEASEERVDDIIGKNNKINTEFGLDSNGNIVFQEGSTKEVYDNIFKYLKQEINRLESGGKFPTILADLGGEEVLQKLIQTAWITTYNQFASSTTHTAEDFVNAVLNNLNKMMTKLQEDPNLIDLYTGRASYADRELAKNLPNCDGDSQTPFNRINYKGEPVQFLDGSIHLRDNESDSRYQETMTVLLDRLVKKYPNVPSDTVTSVFREAQKQAIKAMQSNTADCPYGTQYGSGASISDDAFNWDKKSNRKGDGSKVDMDQLVQLTLYFFDKLLYAETLK